MQLQWFRDLPRWAQAVIPFAILAVVGGAATTALLARSPRPVAIVPSPSPSLSVSPSPSDSPSPSPIPSPSPSASVSTAAAPPPAPRTSTTCAPPAGGFPGRQLTAGFPVALAWSPDGRLFWAERSGAVKVYEGGAVGTFATVNTSTSGERGLLGLAIGGSYVFAFYSNTDGVTQDIVRWTDCGGAARDGVVIAAGIPAGGDCCHKGGRLAVSPDGHLFATVGDNHDAPSAQTPGDLRGKVIRYNFDGGGRTIWTSGLRNPFGIAFAPDGTLAVTNNGPSHDAGTPCSSCGDEFDVVGRSAGVDYEWPYCWGYDHPINGSCHGLAGPQYSTEGGPYPKSATYFVAPTGMTWSTGAFAGHFVFCANSTGHVYEYLGQGSVRDTGLGGCALDVKQGPDGALYTSDAGTIYRQ